MGRHRVARVGVAIAIAIAIADDARRTTHDARRIRGALTGLHAAAQDGVPLLVYLHWSLLDNYEWGSFAPTFGLIAVDPFHVRADAEAQPLLARAGCA